MTNFADDDDLFLSDIGDLSQIYRDDQSFIRNFSRNSRFNKKPAKNADFNNDEDFDAKRFRSTPSAKTYPNSQTEKLENIEHNNKSSDAMNSLKLYDDEDIFVVDSNQETGSQFGNIELSESRKKLKKNEDSLRSKSSLSDSLNSLMNSRNAEEPPWLKSKPSDERRFEARNRNPTIDLESPGAFLNKEDAEKKAFGKWFNDSPKKVDVEKEELKDLSSSFMFSNDGVSNSAELLDENYPNVNPLKASKAYKPLRFSFEKPEDKKAKSPPKETENEKLVRQTMEGLRKRFENENDVVNVAENQSAKVSSKSSFTEANISNMIESIKNKGFSLNQAQQIPVLDQTSSETLPTIPFSLPPPKTAPAPYNMPPPLLSYPHNPPTNYGMNNPRANFINPFQVSDD